MSAGPMRARWRKFHGGHNDDKSAVYTTTGWHFGAGQCGATLTSSPVPSWWAGSPATL